jgi:hypothetical protein
MKMPLRTIKAMGCFLILALFNTCGLNDLGMRAHDLSTPYKTWSYLKDHEAPDVAANTFFGSAVDICGNYMIVGARGYSANTGRAYIFYWNGSTWDVVATFTGNSAEQFGFSVAISTNYAVVGAPYYDQVVPTAQTDQGRVYFYALNGTNWIADGWVTTGDANDLNGYDVDIDGTYCIVGSMGAGGTGAAYVYERNAISWEMAGGTALTPSNAGVDDFGASVAISGNIAVVGAPLSDVGVHPDAGSAYVYERSTTGGLHWGTLTFTEDAILNESTLKDNAQFGYSVDITQIPNVAGSTIIVGAPNAGGVVYFFTGSGITWTQVAGLTPTDTVASDYFGFAVGINGPYALVGAYADADKGAGAGSAYSFEYKFGTWTQTVTGSKLLAPDGAAGDSFGGSLKLSGSYAIIGSGSRRNGPINVGKVYLFQ